MHRHRACSVCFEAGELLCVRLRDPRTGVARLFPPGGKIETGETPAAAARRETLEETGYHIDVDPRSERVTDYLFVWAGRTIDCTTHFFRAELASGRHAPAAVHDAPYHEGVVWLPRSHIEAELGYHPAILAAVRALCA